MKGFSLIVREGILKGVIKKKKCRVYFTVRLQIKMESVKPKREELFLLLLQH